MLAENLLAIPNQFGDVGDRHAFPEENSDKYVPELMTTIGNSQRFQPFRRSSYS
jgi:hypothetical protein